MKSDQKLKNGCKPAVVLICHQNDAIDAEGIAAWLANKFHLAGIVMLQDKPAALLKKLRKEYRRVGLLRLFDVVMFRFMYQMFHARKDAAWVRQRVGELQLRYPADLGKVPCLVTDDPNSDVVRSFITSLQADFTLARCKFILKEAVFSIPRCGTYVLHPGICPTYRNAHGCFWALVNRDLGNVGMTLLKVDSGIDTGPVYLQSSYGYDESRESHVIIQHRVVLENLPAIGDVLEGICNNTVQPRRLPEIHSMNWGQPWLTAYVQWQRSIRGAAS